MFFKSYFEPFIVYSNYSSEFCSEIPFSKKLYHIETSPLICYANQLSGCYMIRGFTERYFQIDYKWCLGIFKPHIKMNSPEIQADTFPEFLYFSQWLNWNQRFYFNSELKNFSFNQIM